MATPAQLIREASQETFAVPGWEINGTQVEITIRKIRPEYLLQIVELPIPAAEAKPEEIVEAMTRDDTLGALKGMEAIVRASVIDPKIAKDFPPAEDEILYDDLENITAIVSRIMEISGLTKEEQASAADFRGE